MNRSLWHVLVGAAMVPISASLASATSTPTQQQIDWCINKRNTYSPEQQIDGCTVAIRSNWWSGKGIVWAFNDRCDAHGRNHEPDLALEDCNEALRLDPDYVDAYANRCFAYSERHEPDLALADCNEAIRRRPDYVLAYNNRGIAYQTKGDLDRAIDDYNKAERLGSKYYVAAVNNRGTAYEAKGDFDRAIADYRTAIIFDRKFARAYGNLCRARAVVDRDLQSALANCDEFLYLQPNDARGLDSRGLVHLKLGSFAQAITDYDAAIAQNATDADSLYGRGIAKLKSGDAAGGSADIAAAKAIQPDIDKIYAGYRVN
jgi:tetratricopeptide (TPR) repeat protein